MKTSILISTLAALSLMINLGQTFSHRNAVNNTVISVRNYTNLPAVSVSANPVVKLTIETRKLGAVKTSIPAEDLSYLKYNVADYVNAGDMATEVYNENSFDYLKFDVNKYSDNNESIDHDAVEMPVNEFEYLKFNVTEYTQNDELTSLDAIESQVNEFNYLKFDISKYMNNGDTNSSEITEHPVDHYSYLKFDISNFMTDEDSDSSKITELPADNYSYLKFDATEYTDQNTTDTINPGEMPVGE